MSNLRVVRNTFGGRLMQALQITTTVLLPAFFIFVLFRFSNKPDSPARELGLLVGILSMLVYAILMFQQARISALEKIITVNRGHKD